MGQALRRAFLCGVDHYSGQSYQHRWQWVVDRIRLLSSLFAIDVCAYAVMQNHYHLALKLYPGQLEGLSDDKKKGHPLGKLSIESTKYSPVGCEFQFIA